MTARSLPKQLLGVESDTCLRLSLCPFGVVTTNGLDLYTEHTNIHNFFFIKYITNYCHINLISRKASLTFAIKPLNTHTTI